MTFLDSSAIRWADYDFFSQVLTIQFTGGGSHYSFYRVPAWVFHELIHAASPGRYYHEHIRDRYSR